MAKGDVDRMLHPMGRCACGGEGRCDWCTRPCPCGAPRIECAGCGAPEPPTTGQLLEDLERVLDKLDGPPPPMPRLPSGQRGSEE